VRAGSDGCTTSIDGELAISEIGAKSFSVSNGSLRYRLGLTACGLETYSNV
jgi:hypothetical protein